MSNYLDVAGAERVAFRYNGPTRTQVDFAAAPAPEATRIQSVHLVLGDEPNVEVRYWLDVTGREVSVLSIGHVTISPNHCTPTALRALAAAATELAGWVEEQTGVTA